MTDKKNKILKFENSATGEIINWSIKPTGYTIKITSKTNFFRRLWTLISNPFSYLFFGKIRY